MTESHSEETSPDLVTIRTLASEFDALFAKSVLEAAGIDCILIRDDCGGYQPSLIFVQGIKLIVRSEDADRAEQVLSDEVQNSD